MKLDVAITGTTFFYSDLIKSSTAARLSIDNTPGSFEIGSLILLAQNVLEPIKNQFPINLLSGYRCLQLNRAIGAGDNSNHVKGEAEDIEPSEKGTSLMTLLEWIYYNLSFHELIAEFFPAGWIHVAYRNGVDDKVLKLKDKDHNYSRITLDELKEIYSEE
jgi:hypothetical protein